jgi:hypothetical protein
MRKGEEDGGGSGPDFVILLDTSRETEMRLCDPLEAREKAGSRQPKCMSSLGCASVSCVGLVMAVLL